MILSQRNIWLCLSLSLLLSGTGPIRAQEARLLFHVPFDGSVDAVVAGGEGVGQWSGVQEGEPAAPEFGPGIRGRALEIGKYQYEVRYAPEGNLRPDRGSLTFWARRVGEPPETPYTFHYLGWDQPDGTWVWIYNWTWNPLMALHGRGGAGDVGVVFPDRDDDGEWHLIGLTWDGSRVRGYFDGDPAGGEHGEIEDFPLVGFQSLWVGRGGAGVSRLLDDLKVFDQPLSPSEMKRLYREVVGPEAAPYLTIPRRTAPITVDGRITDEEWKQAAQTTGFIDRAQKLIGPTPTRAWLTYDAEHLYLALRSELPEHVREQFATTIGRTGILKQDRTGFDTDVDADDAMEVLVRPRGLGQTYSSTGVEAASTWGMHTDMRLEFQRVARLGPVSGETSSWLECDGLLWTVLVLPPQNAEIRRLVLRIPLRKEWSEYLNAYDYSTVTTGRLARVAPQGRPVGRPAWLGNGEGGLQWMAETTAPWRLAEGTPAAQVQVGEGYNILQLTFLDRPTALTGGFEVAFGLVATPVRPPTPGYRTWATNSIPAGPATAISSVRATGLTGRDNINKTERDYHRLYSVDAFLAQSRGHNFGLTNYFLDELARAKAIETDEEWAAVGSQPVDHLFGLILLHDSTYWMAYGRGYEHTVEVLQRIQFDDRYRMIPYWKQKIIDDLPEDVFVTFYCDDAAKRVLMVLLNNTEENLHLRLKLDWAALGLDPGRVRVDDTWAAQATPPADPALAEDIPLCTKLAHLEDGELATPVGHANMRLLVLEEERTDER